MPLLLLSKPNPLRWASVWVFQSLLYTFHRKGKASANADASFWGFGRHRRPSPFGNQNARGK